MQPVVIEGGGCPGRELWDVLSLVGQRAGDLRDQVEDGLVDEAGLLEDEGVEVGADGFAGFKMLGVFLGLGCCCCCCRSGRFAALPSVLRLVVSVMLTSSMVL